MIRIECDRRLRMPLRGEGSLPELAAEELRKALRFDNPQAKKLEAMGRRYHSEPKFYDLWRHEEPEPSHWELSIPRGCMDKLREVISKHGLSYEVVDQRSSGDADITGSYEDAWNLAPGCLFPPYRRELWTHQAGVVEAIKKYEQVLIRSPTGSGKTSAVIAAISELKVPALVIMWDTGLLKQWQERIAEELGIPVKQQGLIQGKVCRLRGITLAMQQTLAQWGEDQWQRVEGVFGLVACDEVQRYAAKTFTHIIDRLDCKYRIGVSADERRKDGKQFLIYAQFGQVRHEVSRKELVDKHLIHEVEVYVVPTNFRAEWYKENQESDTKVRMDPRAHNRLLDEMEDDKERNRLAVHLIDQCVKAGLPTLAFTHRVDHAMKIDRLVTAKGIASGLALGSPEWSQQFDLTIASLRDGSYQVGVGTFGKLGVGHDIPTVAAGVAVTPVHNNRPFLGQVKGRICRTSQGKDNARIIVLWDQHVFGLIPLFNLKRWNEVVKVWDQRDRRWIEISKYIQEVKRGRGLTTTETAEAEDGLFATAATGR